MKQAEQSVNERLTITPRAELERLTPAVGITPEWPEWLGIGTAATGTTTKGVGSFWGCNPLLATPAVRCFTS